MRILITGGFGFVGGRLAVHLSAAGHQILIGTRQLRATPDWLPGAQVVRMEWDDSSDLKEICNSVDVVVHAAGMNAQDCALDPEAALAFNGIATARLALAANQAGVGRFIYLSTAHVYSSPLIGTINEETPSVNNSIYCTSHLAGEHATLDAGSKGGMQGIVLRLSNVYGAPVDKSVNCWMLLANDLCRQAVKTRKLVLSTNGMQQRDFIDMREISQVVEYFLSCRNALMETGIFNVGSGTSQSVLEMAKLIQLRCTHTLGFTPPIERGGSNADDISTPLVFEISKIKSAGYSMRINDDSEIDSMLLFCKREYGGDG